MAKLKPLDEWGVNNEVLSPELFQRFLRVIRGLEGPRENAEPTMQFKGLLSFFVLGGLQGLRTCEMIRERTKDPVIEWRDFLWKKELIVVRDEVAKQTRSRERLRYVPLEPVTIQLLKPLATMGAVIPIADSTFACVIPGFESTGLLPGGIHWASWEEIVKLYGINPHRKKLLEGLERAIAAFAAAGCRILYLDGSFVTEKPLPNDYDACWDTEGVTLRLLDPVLLDFSNLRAAQKAKYFGEFFPAHSRAEGRRRIEYFWTFSKRIKTQARGKESSV